MTVTFAFLFFTIQLIQADAADVKRLNASFTHFGPQYLLLLGGPFAAAVLAQVAKSSQVAGGTVQETPADVPAVTNVVTNDSDGSPAISDAQFLLFNLVALGYFAVALARTPQSLPDIPSTLVALTSVSALTYLGAKVATTNPPKITSVLLTSSPSDGNLYAGQRIKIVGSGFLPASTYDKAEHVQKLGVLFGSVEVQPEAGFSDSTIEAIVPRGLGGTANGNISISVRTAADVITSPFVGLLVKGPKILSAVREGTSLKITGYGIAVKVGDEFAPVVVDVKTATGSRSQVPVSSSAIEENGLSLTLAADPLTSVVVTITVDGLSDSATTAS